jgi:DNA mismatch endonuclease, patch repair protein
VSAPPPKTNYVPWPDVADDRRRAMRSNKSRDTSPEVALRSALHRRGLRFRVDHPVQLSPGRPVRPDIVFPRAKVAVFVDGCFWHRCPIHGSVPKSRRDYWEPKLQRNAARDRDVDRRLRATGWSVIRVWEHEDPERVLPRIGAEVARRTASK